jgi:hypothetical protein
MVRRGFLTIMVALFFVIGVLPVLSMLMKSVMLEGRFSLASYEGLMASAHQWTLMGHSTLLSSLVTVLTVLVGMPLGILLGKTDLPFRRFFTALFVVPLLIPPYIIAVSWFDLLGREGLLAHLIGFSAVGATIHLLVKKYDAAFVALLLGVDGIPRDASERGVLAAEIVHKATSEYGIAEEDIWFDPIVLPINVQLQQVQACFEFTEQIPYMAPNGKSTCGISNVSNGSPNELRPILNQTYMIMLEKQGMYSCIMDPLDEGMMEIAKGGKQDIVKLIHKMLDGEDVNPNDLNPEELKYYKTVRVLRGDILYSDSWLDV